MNQKSTTGSGLGDQLIKKILQSAKREKLVVVIGAGVSIGLSDGQAASWSGLIKNGFDYARKKGRITPAQVDAWTAQLASTDIDELLSAAEFMGRKLGAPTDTLYARWLQESFESLEASNLNLIGAIKEIAACGIPICTLNYDFLLEDITGLPSLQLSETTKVLAWMRHEYPAILHLHGTWDTPKSCILGIRDYESTQADEVRDLFQRNLAALNHLLFIGCGDTFADPNFSALVNWLRKQLNAVTPQHVALVRESDFDTRNVDTSWAGFAEPLIFGREHDELAFFILQHFSKTKTKRAPKKRSQYINDPNTILNEYRDFLLRDCGQMTIEGVSADLDTGQRKFDLERLFVPLSVTACPPEFPANDPKREAKMEEWLEKNSHPCPFGAVLAKSRRLALLALPGGGKTLLLKRLTVAYADPARRVASPDHLPPMDIVPVLIRCREWREHIRLPIGTLLQKMGEITGLPNLASLSQALEPALKKGQVLLLVDGLDEIHNDADRTTFVDHLESFLERYKQIRVVITSREAGFALVAPTLSRFCEKWRVAPLSEEAITMLSGHWHRLMTGDTPASDAEAQDVAQTVLKNGALRRLAENPLLLTMLLVVKHGAGGLPPDRVSLYSRAVEVLLDTWNIKGHDPLNAKEAVPQLAYVAFQLMRTGKQTATESELLTLLESARDKHPNIKRFAKDSPHAFLKRVELRSSLLLEAGHQIENGRAVPFYQFRHLTFQEYLTAVAVVEGHYEEYRQEDTVLTPLADHLVAEEWKEVIPMVAVLARKRAEPLIAALSQNPSSDLRQIERDAEFTVSDQKIAGASGRLLQCFVEEAEASPETISSALQLIALHARGCRSTDDWTTLCRGPYGEELFRRAWELYITQDWRDGSWLMNTCAAIAAYREQESFWTSEQGRKRIDDFLKSDVKDDYGRGLLICMGLIWNSIPPAEDELAKIIPLKKISSYIFHDDRNISAIAIWAWTNARERVNDPDHPDPKILDALSDFYFEEPKYRRTSLASYSLTCQIGIRRAHWTPQLTVEQKLRVITELRRDNERKPHVQRYETAAAFFIAYHSRTVTTDAQLREYLLKMEKNEYLLRGGMKRLEKIKKVLAVSRGRNSVGSRDASPSRSSKAR